MKDKKFDAKIFASLAGSEELVDFPDVKRGWGISIDETDDKPSMEHMNGAFNRIDNNIHYILSQSIMEFQPLDIQYTINSLVKYNGGLWRCIKDYIEDDEVQHIPGIDKEYWVEYISGDITGDIRSLENDVKLLNENLTAHKKSTDHPDATLDTKGFVRLNNTVDSTSTTVAGTANSVKTAYDRGTLGVTNAATAQSTANTAQSIANNALPKAGGTVTGEIISTSANNYRMIDKNRGFFFRLDDNCFYIMRTKENDPMGNWDTFRPFRISTVDDIVYIGEASFKGNVMDGTATNSQKLDGKSLSYFATSDAVVTAQSTANAAKTTAETNASTENAGRVKLNDTVTSTSTSEAATANAVKIAYDKAVSAAASTSFTQNLAQSGWTKLPNGLIIQWGYARGPSSLGVFDVTFPIAFPNTHTIVATQNSTTSSKDDRANSIRKSTNTSFTVHFESRAGFWIAIGY